MWEFSWKSMFYGKTGDHETGDSAGYYSFQLSSGMYKL